MHGYGRYILGENIVYVGHWKNGKKEGKGIESYEAFKMQY